MLAIKNLTYTLPNKTMIENFDFVMDKGEVVGLTGESGIGKTTLARLMAGYLSPDSGTIEPKQQKRKAHPIQLIWQHPEQAVHPKWRMEKVLREAGDYHPSLLKDLQIETDWLNRYADQLSGGQLQRICIARCLLADPQYIIADEITTMLDSISQAEIWKILLHYVREKDVGLVVISHDYLLLEKLCNGIIDFQPFVKRIGER